MKQIGIRGAVSVKEVKTTVPDTSASCPRDKVNKGCSGRLPASADTVEKLGLARKRLNLGAFVLTADVSVTFWVRFESR
jgi:hypothetical protein